MKPRAGWILLALALLAAWSWWRSGPQPQPQGPAPTAIPQPSPPGTTRGDLLPREAEHTLRLIRFGGPFPHRQDGGVFGNRERLLPARERGGECDFRVVNVAGDPGSGTDADGSGAGFGEWPMRLQPGDAQPLRGARPRPLSAFAGQRVHAVAGTGDPQRFFAMLRGIGIAVVPHAFPDHHAYAAEDLQFGSDLPVLMTEKDAVKCAAFAGDRHYSVPVDAVLPEAFWVALLDRLGHARAS